MSLNGKQCRFLNKEAFQEMCHMVTIMKSVIISIGCRIDSWDGVWKG